MRTGRLPSVGFGRADCSGAEEPSDSGGRVTNFSSTAFNKLFFEGIFLKHKVRSPVLSS